MNMNMNTNAVIEQYRKNAAHLKEHNPDMFYAPTPVRDLFKQAVEGATKEELVEMLCLMCNECDWDCIAHDFL